jgi:hypothetical protein
VTVLTLAQVFDRIIKGEEPEGPLTEFVEGFFLVVSEEKRFELIADAPPPTGQQRLDALAGALGEYMAKHFRLPRVPRWVAEPGRYLEHPWHVILFNDGRERPSLSTDEAQREFLTFSSPAEFRSRNIFTEETPLPHHHYQPSQRRSLQ